MQGQRHGLPDDAAAAPEAGERPMPDASRGSPASMSASQHQQQAGDGAGDADDNARRFREQAHAEGAVHPDQRSEGEKGPGSAAEADWAMDKARLKLLAAKAKRGTAAITHHLNPPHYGSLVSWQNTHGRFPFASR